jgi:fatty acid desaturase
VILYNGTLALQAIGWIFVCTISLKDHLTKNEQGRKVMLSSLRFAYFGLSLYALCAIAAFWFPFVVTVITIISWVFWLIYGFTIRQKPVE